MGLTNVSALLLASMVMAPDGEPADTPEKGPPTFRIVTPPGGRSAEPVAPTAADTRPSFRMADAVAIGGQWGRVTSTYRSPDHNRRVGGVRNSYHLRNRAIDIARHRGVTHRQIHEGFRRAGYVLIESLDEGDHSHFAFADSGTVGTRRQASQSAPAPTLDAGHDTRFRIVTPSTRR